MIRILGICGSLRRASTNAALLRAAAAQAPHGVAVEIYAALGGLPVFNPDLAEPLPPAAADLRAQVRKADGLLIASPEYAHGVPGGMKNALDWIVGWGECAGKPVALWQASAYSGAHARAALAEILTTMSLGIVSEAGFTVHLRGQSPPEAEAILKMPAVTKGLRNALAAYARSIQARDAAG